MTGLPPLSTGGLHIHEVQNVGAPSCIDALPKGHYYDHYYDYDPWTSVEWKSSSDGSFTTSSPIEVPNAPYLISNGYVGHAIVLHSPSGAKISCGMILATSSPSPSLSSNDTLAAVLGVLSVLFLLLIAYVCVRMKWYKGEQHLDAKDLLEQANMVEMNVRGSSGREGGGFLDNDSPAAV